MSLSARSQFWVSFTLAAGILGIALPSVLAVLLFGFAMSFGAGPSPFWLILVYPVALQGLFMASRSHPDSGALDGAFRGALVSVGLLSALLVFLLVRAAHSSQPTPRPTATVSQGHHEGFAAFRSHHPSSATRKNPEQARHRPNPGMQRTRCARR